MKIYIIDKYKDRYPELKNKELTNRLVLDLLDNDQARLMRDDRGKPFISWDSDRTAPDISVSHSNDTFACAFADENMGIDLQHERDIDTQRIGRRFFTERECQYIEEDPSGRRFYEIWARKEAFCKYTGMGLEQILTGEEVIDRTDISFEDIRLPDGAYLCICTKAGSKEGDNYEILFSD